MRASVVLENGRVSYREQGQGEVIVLLHGFCCSSESWEKVIPLLSSRYRVLAPDLRGHGQSAFPGGKVCSMDEMAEDLRQLLDSLEIEKVSLFGHSMGGYVSLAFADKYAHRLRHLALIHSTGLADTEQGKESRLDSIKTIEEQGLDVFLEGFVSKFFAPGNPEAVEVLKQRALSIGKQTSPLAAAGCLRGMRERPDRNSVLSGVKLPVLLLAGDQDRIIPKERTFSVAADHIQQAEIQGCGHSSMVEAADELTGVMIDFLSAGAPEQ
ncbi:MAG: alpha/beta hydrolase [Paenibacillus sp.]|nr:alpha/beta hydrolase [Paenibacillus sp.]